MLTVKNVSRNQRIEIICNRINLLFNSNADFWKEVLNHTDNFLYANINGPQLYQFYNDSKLVIQVDTFKSKNPFTKSNGYTKESIPNKMWLNTRRLDRTEASIGYGSTIHDPIRTIPYNTNITYNETILTFSN